MKTLPYDVSRCSARFSFADEADQWCPERKTCQRYLALIDWDKKSGVPDYRGISVTMGRDDCGMKIEIGEDA